MNHTDEEIAAAWSRTFGGDDWKVSKFYDELNRPAIHPRCPVLVDYDMVKSNDLCWAGDLAGQDDATNIRVLIPVETVKGQILDAVFPYVHSGEEDTAIKRLDEAIARYTQHGPEDTP